MGASKNVSKIAGKPAVSFTVAAYYNQPPGGLQGLFLP
jgi:hypothetical protein